MRQRKKERKKEACPRPAKVVSRDSGCSFCCRFLFAGTGNMGGGGKAGEFRYRVRARGVFMLLFLEEEVSTYGEVLEAGPMRETMRERFAKALQVVWIGEGQTFVDFDGDVVSSEMSPGGPRLEVSGEEAYRGRSPRWFYVAFANYDTRCNEECDEFEGDRSGAFACNLERNRR